MGLRFRRSISLCKGVKLNFGLKGVSISSGIPGFRRTMHSSGRVTTSVGIPGSGLYYTTTENSKNKDTNTSSSKAFLSDLFSNAQQPQTPAQAQNGSNSGHEYPPSMANTPSLHNDDSIHNSTASRSSGLEQSPSYSFTPENHSTSDVPETGSSPNGTNVLSASSISSIFEVCDRPVDWIDVLSSLTPTDVNINPEAWAYLHKNAVRVFEGDMETYLDIIQTVNPYDDLLDYAENFEFGAEDAESVEVVFSIKRDDLSQLSDKADADTAFQDFVCALAIRVARDTFALLPVERIAVTVVDGSQKMLSALFDRFTFASLQFVGKDASELIKQFVI